MGRGERCSLERGLDVEVLEYIVKASGDPRHKIDVSIFAEFVIVHSCRNGRTIIA